MVTVGLPCRWHIQVGTRRDDGGLLGYARWSDFLRRGIAVYAGPFYVAIMRYTSIYR